jgi:hypothetical protein
MTKIVRLEPGETMKVHWATKRLEDDCKEIADLVRRRPGIESKFDIAMTLGLTLKRVSVCIRRINENETSFSRIEYGEREVKDGPYAGETRRGWFPMGRSSYQPIMDDADKSAHRVERGVRHSRLKRLAFAHGLGTKAAADVVSSIEARLGLSVEALSETELEAFEELLIEELES